MYVSIYREIYMLHICVICNCLCVHVLLHILVRFTWPGYVYLPCLVSKHLIPLFYFFLYPVSSQPFQLTVFTTSPVTMLCSCRWSVVISSGQFLSAVSSDPFRTHCILLTDLKLLFFPPMLPSETITRGFALFHFDRDKEAGENGALSSGQRSGSKLHIAENVRKILDSE